MLIIINDDPTYVSWISRHRQGFVVDCKSKPKKNHLTLHRATCSIIKPHKRARLTTGSHIKACALEVAELAAWAQEQTGGGLTVCQECHPGDDACADTEQHAKHALTRLGREAISYVLDLAVMYLDGEETNFCANAKRIAQYLGKTVPQVMPVIHRLIDEGYLECDRTTIATSLAATAITYPTARSLRTIPAFGAMSDELLGAELAQLRTGR
jgi:hypothetical protein